MDDGSPVEAITIQPGTDVPAPPTGHIMIGAIEFGPSGATFSSPMTAVFGYDPAQLPQGTDPDNLKMVCYDPQTGMWTLGDYSVNTHMHQITLNLSHFSLYAIMISNSTGMAGFTGVGWRLTGTIIVCELLMGGLVVYVFLRRKRPLKPAPALVVPVALEPVSSSLNEANSGEDITPCETAKSNSGVDITPCEAPERNSVIWDDILTENIKKGEPFKTNFEIIGGKIRIPKDGKSADIELVNYPDSRILVSLEYDPELYPRGLTKILVLGTSEKEKSTEK